MRKRQFENRFRLLMMYFLLQIFYLKKIFPDMSKSNGLCYLIIIVKAWYGTKIGNWIVKFASSASTSLFIT